MHNKKIYEKCSGKLYFGTNYEFNAYDLFGQNVCHRWLGPRKISLAIILDVFCKKKVAIYR